MTKRRRGATTVEMTLVGIPIIFILISTFEISRGMWMYHTTAYAVKAGVRYAIVHGEDCGTIGPISNTCLKTVAQIAQVIQDAGVGLDPNATTLSFISNGGTITETLQAARGDATQWPPDGSNGVGSPIEIDISVPFHSMAALFWPGAKGKGAQTFAVTNFGASSTDRIQF